jgi:hypothetical protein
MSRKLRLFLFIGGGILAVLLLVLACLYWASRHEPAFYRRALAVDAAKRQMLSDEMLRHALEFESKIQREGKWQATFTAEQINGWLGYDLPRNHPQTLSAEFRDPCVSIEPNRMQFGCLYDNGMTSSVLSLAVEPYVPQPNVLALRIVRARAGALPLPLDDVLRGISEAAKNSGCRLDWRQIDGNPVALVTFPSPDAKGELAIKIDAVRLDDGKIFISGSTQRNGK